MRRILVDRARHKRSQKAGGGRQRHDVAEVELAVVGPDLDLLALKAALVKLRFFAGLTIEEAAAALGVSTSTADNDWAYARCWLRLEMEGPAAGEQA